MAINISEPDYNGSFYLPMFNPMLFTLSATAGETKVIIRILDKNDVVIVTDIILLFDSNNSVIFDASPYLKSQNSNNLSMGQYTSDLEDTNNLFAFKVSYDDYPQASPATWQDSSLFYAVNAVVQIGNTAGNNLYNSVAIAPQKGTFLTEFAKVRHWEGYPQSISWVNNEGGVKEITTTSNVVTLEGYTSTFNNVYSLVLPDKAEDYNIKILDGIVFTTEWNTATDGNFVAAATLSAGTAVWAMPDGTEIETASLNTNNSSIDGNPNEIAIIGDLTALEIRNKKCSGTLDLTRFNFNGNLLLDEVVTYGFSSILLSDSNTFAAFIVRNNNNITSIDLSNSAVTSNLTVRDNTNLTTLSLKSSGNTFITIDARGNTSLPSIDLSGFTPTSSAATVELSNLNALTSFTQFTGTIASFTIRFTALTSIDISNIVSDFIRCDQQSSLTSATLTSSTKSIGSLFLNDNDLSTVNQGGLVYDSTLVELNLEDNNATTGEVDTFLSDADSRAVGSSTGTMRFGGTNAAPTGGAANVNVVSLVAKGFTVIHT